MSKNLAIRGGPKLRTVPFPRYAVIGEEERLAADRVIASGHLSRYIGAWCKAFYGGAEVLSFEAEWSTFFGVKHSLAVNSCTSGLNAAVGALGLGPGDEVIVSPYTMSASAVAPLHYGAIPVFADIDSNSFCLSPRSIEQKITSNTKAIIVVHLFGQPAAMSEIMEVARRHNLKVIEDCAQAPGATVDGRYVGTIGDIGVFSFNYHKHIHTGEGGMVVTSDDEYAARVSLIRNHAESAVEGMGRPDLVNMIGQNYRMGEIEAAIGREQLKKLPSLIDERIQNVKKLEEGLSGLPGISFQKIDPATRHVYYVHPLIYDESKTGIPRRAIVDAIKAELPETELREGEGALIAAGYVRPLYLLPAFQKRIAFGAAGAPFTTARRSLEHAYRPGTCPTAEWAHQNSLITHELMKPGMAESDIADVVEAFKKVWSNLHELHS